MNWRTRCLLLSLVLGAALTLLAAGPPSVPTAPSGFCNNAPSTLISAINAVLTSLGYSTIC